MPQPLRVAVIGLGEIAESRHLPVLTAHPHFQVTAAAELDAARAARVAGRFSIPNVSADVRAVIASEAVDVVAILTPPFTHAELGHAALDAGKHILMEKPLTLDVTQAKALAEHAERVSTKFLAGFNQRHHIHIQRARALVRAGQLGRVRSVSTFWGNTSGHAALKAWRSDATQGGDLLFDLGVHHFDAVRFLLDANVLEIQAQEATTADGNRTLVTQMRLSNDALLTTTLAEDTVEQNAFEIVGERGTLMLRLYAFDGLRFIPRGVSEGRIGMRVRELGKSLAQLPAALPRIRSGGEYVLTYRAEWEHFYDVIANDVPPLATARDGFEVTRIAAAARESVTRHAPVIL